MKKADAVALIFFILLCEAVGIAGSFFTVSAIPDWYSVLAKPDFAPPNWIFGPVWTTLYAMMGGAAYLVWKRLSVQKKAVERGLKLFWIQLSLNALWSPIFFGANDLALSVAVIVLLWLSIVGTMVLFARVSKIAVWLLVPYLAWVSFATYLNYSIWQLNT